MAADMPVKAPEGPVPMWGWTEFYFGLNIGCGHPTTSWCTEAEGTVCPGPIISQRTPGRRRRGRPVWHALADAELTFGARCRSHVRRARCQHHRRGRLAPTTQTRYTEFNNLSSATGSWVWPWAACLRTAKAVGPSPSCTLTRRWRIRRRPEHLAMGQRLDCGSRPRIHAVHAFQHRPRIQLLSV